MGPKTCSITSNRVNFAFMGPKLYSITALSWSIGVSEECPEGLVYPAIGQIDLIWGEPGTQKSDGYGLSKIIQYHPEVLEDLQGIINGMTVIEPSSENRINLESDCYKASVRLTWDNVPKKWLLTAYKKKNSVPDNTTDTGETLAGERNGTATPQNTVSEFKGINKY